MGNTEIWKSIPGYETRYDVSNMGRVRSWRTGGRTPKDSMRSTPKILKLWEGGKGVRGRKYPHLKRAMCVGLFSDGRLRTTAVHKLVLLAFVGPCPPGQETRHLNDDRHDNRIKNLTWGTRKENWADRKKNGRGVSGEKNGRSKLTKRRAAAIRRLKGKLSQEKIGERFGVCQTTVSKILRGISWRES